METNNHFKFQLKLISLGSDTGTIKLRVTLLFLIIALFIPFKILSSNLNIKKHEIFTDLNFECIIQYD